MSYTGVNKVKDLMMRMNLINEVVNGDEKGEFGDTQDMRQGAEEVGNLFNDDAKVFSDEGENTWNMGLLSSEQLQKEKKYDKNSIMFSEYTDKYFGYVIREVKAIANKEEAYAATTNKLDGITNRVHNEKGIFRVYDAIILTYNFTQSCIGKGPKKVEARNTFNDIPNKTTFSADIEEMLKVIPAGDNYKLLRSFMYVLRSNKVSNVANKASITAKKILIQAGLLKQYYSITGITKDTIIIAPLLDDPLVGNVAKKEGIAANCMQKISSLYERNKQNMVNIFNSVYNGTDFETKIPHDRAIGGTVNLFSAADFLGLLLERFLFAVDGRIDPGEGRRGYIINTSWNALKTYFSVNGREKIKDLFQGISLIDLMDDSYTLQDWIADCTKHENGKELNQDMSDALNIKEILNLKGLHINEENGLAVYADGKEAKCTLCEYVAHCLGTREKMEDVVYKLLSETKKLKLTWDTQGGGQQHTREIDKEFSDEIGGKSIDIFCESIGVALEVQGAQHYTSFTSLHMKENDLNKLFSNNNKLNEDATNSLKSRIMLNMALSFKDTLDSYIYKAICKINGCDELSVGTIYKASRDALKKEALNIASNEIENSPESKWNGVSENFIKKLLTDEFKCYLQQTNDIDKYSKISLKPFGSVTWEVLYVSERDRIPPEAIEEAFKVPFSTDFESGQIKFYGDRADRNIFAKDVMKKVYWYNPVSIENMKKVKDNNISLLDTLIERKGVVE